LQHDQKIEQVGRSEEELAKDYCNEVREDDDPVFESDKETWIDEIRHYLSHDVIGVDDYRFRVVEHPKYK
jgi:hypothetical protein